MTSLPGRHGPLLVSAALPAVMGSLLEFHVTMNAKQGIEAMRIVRPDLTVPIHYNDYDIFKEPLDEFVRAVEAAGLQDGVQCLSHGESYSCVPQRMAVEPSWRGKP